MVRSTIYSIGAMGIQVNFSGPLFDFTPHCGSHLFINPLVRPDWTLQFKAADTLSTAGLDIAFEGAETFAKEIPYTWKLLTGSHKKYIHFDLENDAHIECGLTEIDVTRHSITTHLKLKTDLPFPLDPFFHPSGILLLQYLIHLKKGFILHASAVSYKNRGFLFTAVSGTGKSTMARLWQKKGATIINDDRIAVIPDGDEYLLHNTPMPYYRDRNKTTGLNNLFIIKQSKENYIKPLSPTRGLLAILGNCIQYQFETTQIKERLDIINSVCERHGVYELGFKPDTDIIELIIKQFG